MKTFTSLLQAAIWVIDNYTDLLIQEIIFSKIANSVDRDGSYYYHPSFDSN